MTSASAGRAARQQERELVATDPIAAVGAAEVRADDLADRAEHLVARSVSAPIVRLLEVVDVDHQQRQRRVLLLGLEDLVVELLLERPVIAEARQPVAQRIEAGPVEGLLEPDALPLEDADVAADDPVHQHQRDPDDRPQPGDRRDDAGAVVAQDLESVGEQDR